MILRNSAYLRYKSHGIAGAFGAYGNSAVDNGWFVENGAVGLGQGTAGVA